jgi:hypothetical protein
VLAEKDTQTPVIRTVNLDILYEAIVGFWRPDVVEPLETVAHAVYWRAICLMMTINPGTARRGQTVYTELLRHSDPVNLGIWKSGDNGLQTCSFFC